MSAAPARVAIAAALALLAWRAVHVNAFVYADENRPVTRPAAGEPLAQAAAEALRANPADVRALLMIARERDHASDASGTAAAYEAALAIAPVERVALHEAAAADLRNGRVAEALARMDALATHYDEERPAVFEVMGRMLGVPQHRALMEARAAQDPRWLTAFMAVACAKVEPQDLAPLFMRRAAAGRSRPEEVGCMTDRLRRAGQWPLAYQAWLNSLPRARLSDVGYVFNGGFEHTTSGVGFDWIVAGEAVQAVEFTPARGATGDRALRVSYGGKRILGPALRQYLALAPGRYQLTGRVHLDGLSSVRGVQWTVRCGVEPNGIPLASSERFLGSEPWRAFTFPIAVPSGCPGQVLTLEPAGLREGTTFVSGAAFFDELRVAHAR